MNNQKHTPEDRWILGWGDGVTGPTTPNHPTVHESIEHDKWSNDKTGKYPYPGNMFTMISTVDPGKQTGSTIAIFPDRFETGGREEGEANAKRAFDCVIACKGINPEIVPDLLIQLKSVYRIHILDEHTDYDGERSCCCETWKGVRELLEKAKQ